MQKIRKNWWAIWDFKDEHKHTDRQGQLRTRTPTGKPGDKNLFQLLGMSYNHKNLQVDAEKYFKKLLGGGI